jgi:hypothetical protein
MSLKTQIVVKQDAAVSFTGGVDLTYMNNGDGVNGANILVNVGNDSTLLRESIMTRTVLGTLAPNDKALAKLTRSTLTYKQPFVDSKGKLYLGCGGQLILVSHPEFTTAMRGQLLLRVLAAAGDTELVDFFTKNLNA